MNSFIFTISDSAAKRLEQIIQDKKNSLRIAVDSGGCSGFQYSYDITDQIEDTDFIIKLDSGISIVIDCISQKFLYNSTLEFIKNLGGSYFKIINPNASKNCGCGNSFNV